jgi:arylsulfatase A-like enzyme
MSNNTYIIFASDNGGCPQGGSRNTPLRGGKSTLFEGGTRVESFIYNPLLPTEVAGSTYYGLTHVADWFPTMLKIANITYTAPEGYELDGFDQYGSILGIEESPREYMLYNYYYNVSGQDYQLMTNGGGAIRNDRYKLLHTYISNEEHW